MTVASYPHISIAADSGDPFALLVSDLQMPEVDGLDLVERIRAQERFESLAILLLSSAGAPPDAARCDALRVGARLAKPIKQQEFARAVARMLGAAEEEAPASRALSGAESLVHLGAAERPLRVLLVEDSVANQKVALAMLGDGADIEVASDGAEAVRAFQEGAFDVVLMDVQMPVMDGYASTAAIRSLERATGRRVPIIAMTAHASSADRGRCLAAGMDDYISKPIRRDSLLAALTRVTGEGGRTS
jgi:CheY-like chemotaxis protein